MSLRGIEEYRLGARRMKRRRLMVAWALVAAAILFVTFSH